MMLRLRIRPKPASEALALADVAAPGRAPTRQDKKHSILIARFPPSGKWLGSGESGSWNPLDVHQLSRPAPAECCSVTAVRACLCNRNCRFRSIDINKDLIFMVTLTNIGCAGSLLETRDGVAGANVIVRKS